MAGRIQYELGFKNDSSSFEKIKQELKSIQQMTQAEYLDLNKGLNAAQAASKLKDIREEATKLQTVLQQSFNQDLGSLNISKFNQELKKLDLNGIYNKFSSLGSIGKQAFRDITTQAMTTNLQLKKTHNILEEMKTTMGNTIKWGIASSAMNNLTGSVQKAYSFVKGLDSSLNDIRIVTGKSADEMERFAKTANSAAKNLGATTRDYTDAALIYYQQGLNEQDTAARTDVTVKTANVTKQSADKVSEQLTAIWNGYKVQSQEAELYIDKVAKVAATTAADLEELSTGMSKVASAASTMGVDFDDLNAMLATVISVTRESPETIGTSFKNIFARMSQLQTSGTDDEGVELTKVTKQMQDLGIEILDQDGKLKNMSSTIHEVAAKWNEWSSAQQVAAARVMAGTQQYSRFMALMNNQDMWESALEDSKTAQGELSKQNDIYLDSMEAHLNKMKAAWEGLYDSLFNTDAFNGLIDSLTFVVEQVNSLVDSIGGAGNAFLLIGSIATRVFSKDISAGIATTITNIKNMKSNAEQVGAQIDNIKILKEQLKDADSVLSNMINIKETTLKLYQKGIISEEELNNFNLYIERIRETAKALEDLEARQKSAQKDVNKIFGENKFTTLNDINKKATDARKSGATREEAYDQSGAKATIKKLEGQEKHYQNLEKGAKALFETTKKYNDELDKADGNIDIISNSYDKMLERYYSGMKTKMQQVINSDFVATDLKRDLVSAWKDFDQTIGDEGEEFKQVAVEEFEVYFETILEKIKERIGEIKQEYKDAGEGAQYEGEQNVKEAQEDASAAVDEKALQQRIQGYVQTASAIMQIGSAITTVTNLGKIWQDESLSGGEKVKQTFMALLTTFISLAPALLQIRGALIAATAAQRGLTTEQFLATVAAKKMGVAMWESLGPYLPIVLAVVAALGLLVVSIMSIVDAYNADANAAKNAAEGAKQVSEETEKVQQSLENLKQSFNAYDTAVEKLKKCTKGTEEWKEALEEVNQTAIDVLDNIPIGNLTEDIGELYSRDKTTGQIVIDNEKMENIIKSMEATSANMKIASASMDYRSILAANKSTITDLSRSITKKSNSSEEEIKQALHTIAGEMQNTSITTNEFKQKLQDLGIDISQFSNTELSNWRNNLSKLSISATNAAKKLELITNLSVTSQIPNATQETQNTVAKRERGERFSYANEFVTGISQDIQQWNYNNKAMAGTYGEILNILNKNGKNYSKADDPYQINNHQLEVHFFDNDTQQDIKFTSMAIADIAASLKTGEMAKIWGEEVENALTNYGNNASKENENTLREFLKTGDVSNLTQKQVSDLREKGADTESLAEAMGLSVEDFYKTFGTSLEYLGINTGSNPFDELFLSAKNSMVDYLTSTSETLRKELLVPMSHIDLASDLTYGQKERLAQIAQEAFETGGKQSLDGITSIYKSLKSNEVDEFAEAIRSTRDWANISAKDLQKELKDSGITADFTTDQLNHLIESMERMQYSAQTLSDIFNSIANVTSVIDGLEKGDTIEAEEYQLLIQQMGDGISQYFTKMRNGTYKLIESSEDFQEIINNWSTNKVSAKLEENNIAYDKYKTVKDKNINFDDYIVSAEKTTEEILEKRKKAFEDEAAAADQAAMDAWNKIKVYQPGSDGRRSSGRYVLPNEDTPEVQEYKRLQAKADSYYGEKYITEEGYGKIDLKYPDFGNTEEDVQSRLQTQFDILSAFYSNKAELQEWMEAANSENGLTTEQYENIAKAVESVKGEYEQLTETMSLVTAESYEASLQILSQYDNVRDLREAYESKKGTDEEFNGAAYSEAMIQLEDSHRREDLDDSEIEKYADYLQDVAAGSKEWSKDLKDNAEDAENLSIQVKRMNKGVDDLADNWKNWSDILKNSSKGSEEYYQALTQTQEALSDLLDIEPDFLSDGFITDAENMKLIGEAAKGDEEAIDSLRQNALQDIVLNMKLSDEASIDNQELWNRVQNAQAIIDTMGPITAGTHIDLSGVDQGEAELINYLNEMIASAGMSADQVNAMLSGMGFQANFAKQPQKVMVKEPDTTIEHVRKVSKGTVPGNDGETIEEYDIEKTVETKPGKTHEGSVDAYSLETSEPGTTVVPKIESMVAKATGSANNYSSKNKGGGSPGKGSKGGGGSQKKPKKEDKLKDESDRYHDINIKLKQIETSLNRLQKSKDRLFGGTLVKNLNKQLGVLNQQIDASNKKINIAKGEVNELQGKLGAQGLTFNADGTIANYQSAYKAQLDAYNSLVNQYNSLGVDAQEKWDEDETLKKAKEKFDEFVKDMQNYDTLVTETIPDLEDQISEALYQKITIKLEAFDVAANIRLDLAQAKKDWEEFEKYVIKRIRDDDIFGQMKYSVGHDLSTYFNNDSTGKVQTAQKQVDFYRNRLQGIDPDKNPEEFKATLEKLEEWNNTLQEGLREYQEAIDNIREMELNFLDEINEKLEEQLSLYDQIESMIERDLDVFQSVFGDKASVAALEYLDKQMSVIEQRQSFLEEDVDIWKTEMDNAKARMENAKSNMDAYAQLYGKESEQYLNAKDEFDHAQKVYKTANEKYIDALDKSAENIQKKLELLSQKMEMQVNIDLDDMERSLLGGKTLDETEKEWEMAKKQADLYLDSINAIYGVQKLQRKYQTAIDNTSSITAQRKLNAIMEDEIKLLEDKDKLTQYDLDRANKKYEIALKQMELEDQMNNKSTMRLQRDQQGNYEYQFVADQDQIATLQEELSDLKNELYNLDLEEWNASMERMRDFTRDMIEDMRDIALDANLTVDEKNALLEERYGQYQKLMTSAAQIGEDARVNLIQSSFLEITDFYNNDNEAFQNNLGQKFAGMEEWILQANEQVETFTGKESEAWSTMVGGNIAALKGLYEHMNTKTMPNILAIWTTTLGQMSTELAKEDGFIKLTKTSFDNLTTTVTEYGNAIEKAFREYEEWSGKAQYAAQETANENRNVTETLREQLSAINELSSTLTTQINLWTSIAAEAKKSAEQTYNYIKALKELEAAKAEAEANEIKRREEEERRKQQQNQQSSQPAASSGGGGGGGMYTVKSGDTLTSVAAMRGNANRWREILNANAWIDDDSRAQALRRKYGTSDGHWIFPGQQLVLPFETGGYTGDWGDPNGRIAMLHKKELVLNQEDTRNLLNAIELMRNVNGKLTDSLRYELENIIGTSLSSMMAMMTIGGEMLEQQVTIDAYFPNVTNSHEVEDAINNLINTASQRAGRNKD